TTRSVAPTDAGEELLRSSGPALTDTRAALGRISGQREKPAGRVRLVVSPLAAASVLGPKLGAFAPFQHARKRLPRCLVQRNRPLARLVLAVSDVEHTLAAGANDIPHLF